MADSPTRPLICKLFARGASVDSHADAYFTITAPLPGVFQGTFVLVCMVSVVVRSSITGVCAV